MHSLLRTSAFRLTLAYTGLFALFGLGLIGFIYWTTIRVLDSQADATIEAEILGLVEQYRGNGLEGLLLTLRSRTEGTRREGSLYLLQGPDGRDLAGNLHGWPNARPDPQGWLEFSITPLNEPNLGPLRARARAFALAGGFRLLVGRDLTERRTFQRIILVSLGGALGVLLVLGLVGGLLTSRNLLHRLDAINRTSGEILAGSLDRRIPMRGGGNGDEFDRLAANLNAMLDQIEQLMTGMRQVTDNLAHDLRSPLTRLRGRLDQMLGELQATAPGTAGHTEELALSGTLARAEMLEQAVADVDGLLATFNALLSIAQAEAGSARRHFEPVDLAQIARDAADLYRPAAEEKGLRLDERVGAVPMIAGDRHLLSQAVANLLDNAIKFTPSGGGILIDVGAGARPATGAANPPRPTPGPAVWLVVGDSGPGVPPALRDRVLERFVRLESSRNTPGSGLGLSLVAAVAKLHRAAVLLEENGPGLRVALEFPGPPAG